MARTYLMLTQGTPELNNFNMDTAEFKAKFTVDVNISEPTRIYFSADYYYPNGVKTDFRSGGVVLTENEQYTLVKSDQYYDILIIDRALQGKVIEISLEAL